MFKHLAAQVSEFSLAPQSFPSRGVLVRSRSPGSGVDSLHRLCLPLVSSLSPEKTRICSHCWLRDYRYGSSYYGQLFLLLHCDCYDQPVNNNNLDIIVIVMMIMAVVIIGSTIYRGLAMILTIGIFRLLLLLVLLLLILFCYQYWCCATVVLVMTITAEISAVLLWWVYMYSHLDYISSYHEQYGCYHHNCHCCYYNYYAYLLPLMLSSLLQWLLLPVSVL